MGVEGTQRTEQTQDHSYTAAKKRGLDERIGRAAAGRREPRRGERRGEERHDQQPDGRRVRVQRVGDGGTDVERVSPRGRCPRLQSCAGIL